MISHVRNTQVFCSLLLVLGTAGIACAQSAPELRQILERLDRVESANRALLEEVRALRRELAQPSRAKPAENEAGPPPQGLEHITERLDVHEARLEEQAQSKIESSQKFPITLRGAVLLNVFRNGNENGEQQYPTIAQPRTERAGAGASMRQTTIGLEYHGPRTFLGGKISGALNLDLFGGTTSALNHLLRLRTARIDIDWKNNSITLGQEKPLISPRNPVSLAQVGVPPLTNAGNLWLWQPQIRYEHRLAFDEHNGVRAQAAVIQTRLLGESGEYNGYTVQNNSQANAALERASPGFEGRLVFWHRAGERNAFEFAPAFHVNRSRTGWSPVSSRIAALDWIYQPFRRLEISGAFFHGTNVAVLGALPQGFTLRESGRAVPVHATGGWAQVRLPITERFEMNLYAGKQQDRKADLLLNDIGSNSAGAANFIYRLAPNVLLSLEAGQVRTDYIGSGVRLNNHYDLGVAYLF